MLQNTPYYIQHMEESLLRRYLEKVRKGEKKYLLRNDIQVILLEFLSSENIPDNAYDDLALFKVLNNVQELLVTSDSFVLVYRYKIASCYFYRVAFESVTFQRISVKDYLRYRDMVTVGLHPSIKTLDIDFLPFYDYAPSIKNPQDIKDGIRFLNKHLSSSLFQKPDRWNAHLFDFIRIHHLNNRQLLINDEKIHEIETFITRLEVMVEYIDQRKSLDQIQRKMRGLGFEPGWGDSPKRIAETMTMLVELFSAPGPQRLENFISRIPMISKIAIISPHGWFGQKDVLGLPDTGGQVVYILDQVRYLEKVLTSSLLESGLSITPQILVATRLIPESEGTQSHLPREKVEHTENTWIVRIPFRNKDGSVHQHWLSRFHMYPYLETFADELGDTMQKEFKGRPDLIIGNYTDGNLVASFLSRDMEVTQCNIAHALEKSKYIFSDLYWENMESKYHFSLQFTADLLAMNMASFIITSTFQEIVGTSDSIGQYESYLYYSLPKLYHVKNGINLFHPKFNVVPPGVAEDIYFPFHQKGNRDPKLRDALTNIIFFEQSEMVRGELSAPDKMPIFALSRLDSIKNVTGLIACFGENKELADIANLIIIAGKINPDDADDAEEKAEIIKVHELIDRYKLHDCFRWLSLSMKRAETGEVYRIIAERKGIFVQPALFEAFGLTVIEAMASGLPTFATQFGGPSEIIEDGHNGFLINPTDKEEMAAKIVSFYHKNQVDPDHWRRISDKGIERVKTSYNWDLYSRRLLNLSKLHGFWKFAVTLKSKEKMQLYCDLIYDDFIRKRLPERT